jgi:hypothetical protein
MKSVTSHRSKLSRLAVNWIWATTIWRIGTFVSVLTVGALLATPPGMGASKVSAAPRVPKHFQSFSNGTGERYVAGPFAADAQLAIASLTVDAPKESSPVVVGLRIAHGAGSSCPGFALEGGLTYVQVPPGDTLHLAFAEPLIATYANERWCLFLGSDVVTDLAIVGVTN